MGWDALWFIKHSMADSSEEGSFSLEESRREARQMSGTGESLKESTMTGEENLKILDSSMKTFMYGISLSDFTKTVRGKWISHPLSQDGIWHQICVQVVKRADDQQLLIELKWKLRDYGVLESYSSERIKPRLVCFVSFKVFDKSRGILHSSGNSCKCLLPQNYGKRTVGSCILDDSTKEAFVSVRIAVLSDEEIRKALRKMIKYPYQMKRPIPVQTINKVLWEDRKLADLVIVTSEGKELHVHRCFLAGSSPVFEAMLTHDFLEKESGRLILNDLSHDVVLETLQFIYLDTVTTTDGEMLLQLLKVANRYDLPLMTERVKDKMISEMLRDNCYGKAVLPAAHLLGFKELKSVSEEFVMSSMTSRGDYMACLVLACECRANRLQRLAAACLLPGGVLPQGDGDWERLHEGFPDVARTLLDVYVRHEAMTCEGEVHPLDLENFFVL